MPADVAAVPTTWIILSTCWSLSSVQASLNVIISVLGTIGLWAFTRFWWRRGSVRVIYNNSVVPLSRLLTISGPGEVWDVVTILGRQILAKHNWHLLVQLIVVIGVTVTCALSGPIAKFSLRNGVTIEQQELRVLHSVKGAGYFGNLLYANVLWNDTAQSLDDAAFPTDQLVDLLPPSTTPWTYVAKEWDSTWKVSCNYTEKIDLQNVTGSGDGHFLNPIKAFPVYRDTYDSTWLDSSNYRICTDFNSWANWSQTNQIQEAIFYVLIQSDPYIDGRMLHNNETLNLSLSALHVRNFRVLYEDASSITGAKTWRPIGPVEYASYARAECVITRKPQVEDEDQIPWPWTNDTTSIVSSYRTFYNIRFSAAAVKNVPVEPASARELFRFYQIYMASINTFHSNPSSRKLSVRVQTVELSLVFLIAILFLSILTAWNSIRYVIFLRHHKIKLAELYVPDGKIEWMIHAVKCSELGIDLEEGNNKEDDGEGDGESSSRRRTTPKRKDSEHFCTATFGPVHSSDLSSGSSDVRLQFPGLAHVKSCRYLAFRSQAPKELSSSNVQQKQEEDVVGDTDSSSSLSPLHVAEITLTPQSTST